MFRGALLAELLFSPFGPIHYAGWHLFWLVGKSLISWLLNISNITLEHRHLGGGARNAGCFAMCRAVDQRGISPCPAQHLNVPPDIHMGKNSACNCLSLEQNYILHISATYFLHDFKCTIFFPQKQLLWELYFENFTWEFYQELYSISEKHYWWHHAHAYCSLHC